MIFTLDYVIMWYQIQVLIYSGDLRLGKDAARGSGYKRIGSRTMQADRFAELQDSPEYSKRDYSVGFDT